jgi:3-hydroxybutyrate dehydrogenase
VSHKPVALVTGSTSGIGLGIAEAFAQKGYDLLIHGLGAPAETSALCERLAKQYNATIIFSDADLLQESAGGELVKKAARELGRIDVLVNNAGIQHVSPIETFPVAKWNAIIALNLSSAFHTTQAALPLMRQQKHGRIINIASVHGLVASVHKAAYVAAKHGLLGLTKVTALETAGSGITCNAICPGWVKTPLVVKQIEDRAKAQNIPIAVAEHALLSEKQPSGQFVTIEQLGELAVFLSSEAASGMTGAALPMDGAWSAQ